jgi:FixJ family two-component response regulator
MTPASAPTVFVIDDDDLVRASIQGMLKSVGLRSETFGTPQIDVFGAGNKTSPHHSQVCSARR